MRLVDIFKRLGYPKHSDVLYDALCKSKKPLSVSSLSKLCRISRMEVYRGLRVLVKNDLVEKVTVGQRTFYRVTDITKLDKAISCFEKEKDKLVGSYSKLREKETPRNLRFLHGASGIRAAFDDVIEHAQKGDMFFRYTSERDLDKVNSYLSRDYRLRRDKKKLERLVISNTVSGLQKKSRLERFIKFIPTGVEQFEQNIIELIYGDRVSLIDLTKKEVIIIENKLLADLQKVIFKLLYKRL
jgi:DNA-binding transcriptional regulator GbsR (MarR family)